MISSMRSGLTALTLLRLSSVPISNGTPDSVGTSLLSPSGDPDSRRTEAEASADLFNVDKPNPVKEMTAMLKRIG